MVPLAPNGGRIATSCWISELGGGELRPASRGNDTVHRAYRPRSLDHEYFGDPDLGDPATATATIEWAGQSDLGVDRFPRAVHRCRDLLGEILLCLTPVLAPSALAEEAAGSKWREH